MNIKTEIIRGYIADQICNSINNFEIDADKITDTIATKMLSEIQQVLKNDEYSDFDMIEKIVCIINIIL